MEVKECLSQRLRDLRQQRGWSQTALAGKAGVPQMTVWRLEKRQIIHPSVVVVRKLAQALGVGVDFLVGTHDKDVEPKPAAVAVG